MWRLALFVAVLANIATASLGKPDRKEEGGKVAPKPIKPGWFCTKEYPFQWTIEFFSERISLERTIVGTRTVDVGTCPTGPCRYNTHIHPRCPYDGYICPQTESQAVDCGDIFGIQNVEVVTGCKCCKDEGIVIQGTVVDVATGEALSGMICSFNGDSVVESGDMGQFESTIKSGVSTVVVISRDDNNIYLNAVKVVDIPKGFRGPVETVIGMVKKTEPLTITDPGVDTILSMSDNPGVAKMVIQANSIKDASGNIFTGIVKVSLTYVDASSPESENSLQGIFETNNGEQLMSDGMFSLELKDVNGNQLNGNFLIDVRSGMNLWNLNLGTGKWIEAPILNRRRKRQVSLTEELLIQINNANWVNIDKITGAPRCYFKARVVYQIPSEASNPVSFIPSIVVFTPNKERLTIYSPFTTANDACFEARCLEFDPLDPTNVLYGFISVMAYENVNVGNMSVPVLTKLNPKILKRYIPTIETAHNNISYNVVTKDIFVNFISDASGAFYPDRQTCENSTITQPAFHFMKPELPSYLPVPDDAEFCTARIEFYVYYYWHSYIFYESLANLTNLPAVTAISEWTEDGTGYYFTDLTTMQFTTDPHNIFWFFFQDYHACIKYRCSELNELTTVQLAIESPMVNVTFDFDGDGVDETVERPAFVCYRGCHSSGLCFQPNSVINGTFTAPENIDIDNNCDNKGRDYWFYCENEFW